MLCYHYAELVHIVILIVVLAPDVAGAGAAVLTAATGAASDTRIGFNIGYSWTGIEEAALLLNPYHQRGRLYIILFHKASILFLITYLITTLS